MILSAAPMPRTLTEEQASLVRQELAAILTSDSFSGSKRCQDFLKFIVQQALAGDYDSLSERFLGVTLFARAVDYETATDSIVRVRANDVRKRLALYYAHRQDWLAKIDLVAGGYIPEFHFKPQDPVRPVLEEQAGYLSPNAAPNQIVEERTDSSSHSTDRSRTRLISWIWGILAVALLLTLAVFLYLRPFRSNLDKFWAPVLEEPSSPLLSLPTTDTFSMKLATAQKLRQSPPGSLFKFGELDLNAFHNWHESLPVIQAALAIEVDLARRGKTPVVRIGTDLRQDEVRGHPVIAIGSFSNPWAKQNVSGLRFTFDRGASDQEPPRIRDAQNPSRTWSLQQTYPQPQSKDYAIVTRTFDPVTQEPFVSLAGLHSFGNQIAAELVTQESSWSEVVKRAPPGWEKMNLQIVLETDVIDTTPSSPRVIEAYFWR